MKRLTDFYAKKPTDAGKPLVCPVTRIADNFGIANLGNTCFMCGGIQMCRGNTLIARLLREQETRADVPLFQRNALTPVVCATGPLSSFSITLRGVKCALPRLLMSPRFTAGQQRFTSEFLRCVRLSPCTFYTLGPPRVRLQRSAR